MSVIPILRLSQNGGVIQSPKPRSTITAHLMTNSDATPSLAISSPSELKHAGLCDCLVSPTLRRESPYSDASISLSLSTPRDGPEQDRAHPGVGAQQQQQQQGATGEVGECVCRLLSCEGAYIYYK